MSKGKVIGALVALAVVGGAAAAFALAGRSALEVDTGEVARQELAVIVSAAGSVSAAERVDVYPPTAGLLVSVNVSDGDPVSAGDVIAVMDVAPLEVQLAQAEAAYAGAVAQREAVTKSAPGATDVAAAQAAVNVAWTAYEIADAQYDAALAGAGAPSASDIAAAEAAVAAAQSVYDAAVAAYDSYYNTVYLPAPEPRDPSLETALVALTLAREQAAANLLTAQQNLAALNAMTGGAATASAKIARDQAYAAYLAALSQREALARASSVTGAIAATDAAIEAAERARDLASATLEKAEIVAPIDGVVLFNTVSGGILGGPVVKPGPGSSVSPAAAPFAVVALESLTFTAQVDEADVTRVDTGMSATVWLDGLPGVEFATEVARVGRQSVLTPTGGTAFPLEFTIDNTADADVLLGMNGSVEIRIETVGSTLAMPIEALLEEGTGHYVYVVDDGVARRAEITVGRMTETLVEVVSGLEAGDVVVTSSVGNLDDGTRVRAK